MGAEWAPISCGPLKTAGQLLSSQAAASPILSRCAVIQPASSFSLMPGLDRLADAAVDFQGFLAGQRQAAQISSADFRPRILAITVSAETRRSAIRASPCSSSSRFR